MSQCAEATGFTIARISSGDALVVKSRSVRLPAEQRIAHRTAHDGELETGGVEGLREGTDDGILGERAETGEAVGHVEHGFQRTGRP